MHAHTCTNHLVDRTDVTGMAVFFVRVGGVFTPFNTALVALFIPVTTQRVNKNCITSAEIDTVTESIPIRFYPTVATLAITSIVITLVASIFIMFVVKRGV